MSLDIADPITGQARYLGRYLKPAFKYASSKSVVVPAASTSPAYFVIAGRPYIVTSDVECNLVTNGAGGMAAALTLTAATVYYLYAVLSNGRVKLVADSEPPTLGPQDFTDWTYIGAFATDSGAATITPFKSVRGFYVADNELESQSHTGGTSPNAETFGALPVTANMAYGILLADGGNTNASCRAMGTNTSGYNALLQTVSVANIEVEIAGYVPIFTSKTIYLQTDNAGNTATFVLLGWVEAPEDYD